jgi:Bacterial type II and III secretion system protein/FG-GAP-like repeat
MTKRPHRRTACRVCISAHFWEAPLVIVLALILGALSSSLRAQSTSPNPPATPPRAVPVSKIDAKKGKLAYQRGMRAEQQKDWDLAYGAYSDAASWVPAEREYLLRREFAKGRLVQAKVDAAERDAVSGRLEAARRELGDASMIDPTNAVVRERLSELFAAEPGQAHTIGEPVLGGEIHLAFQPGTRSFDYRGDTQGAYQELARQFGIEVAFDVELHSRTVRFHLDDVDFPTAARLLGDMTGTFWRPLTSRLFFVSENTPQKRKDYDASVVRTVLLPASETPEQMTEILRMVREIAGITRSDLDASSRTLTLRASPQAIAVAANLIDGLEKPTGELILEIEILEVDKDYARQLGITPPTRAQAFSLSTEQIQEAQTSQAGLIDLIEQIFGGTSIPPLVVIGGGLTTYFATMPGATANFAEMLSLVRQGRRILLRAQDGQPATFFVGDRVPVSLSTFSASVVPGPSSITALINPITNYAAGNDPVSVVTNDFYDTTSTTISDIAVANHNDDTISILQGTGLGTFGLQTLVALPMGVNPTNLATAQFTDSGHQDLAVTLVNPTTGAGSVAILLGNGDGTFNEAPQSPIAVGESPVFVATADFNGDGFQDLAIANQADNTISILLGNGDGTFKAAPTALIPLAMGFTPTALVTNEFTNSGHMDLAITEKPSAANNAGLVQVFVGNGDGTFTQAPFSPYIVGNTPAYIATGDFNGDGILDLVVANSGAPSVATNGTAVTGNSVSVLLGNPNPNQTTVGNGTFAPQTFFAAGNGPSSIAVADYNQDGLQDIAVSDETDNAVTVLLNTSNDTFDILPELPVGSEPVSIASADFNGDGLPDVVTANSGSANLTVILDSPSLFGSTSPSAGTPYPGIEYLDVGLKVKATPRIHPDSDVTLQLSIDISSLSGQDINAIPVISNEAVDQTVRVKENETIVLAGFLQSQVTNAIVGNPGLSSVPGVGLLDQDQNAQQQDSELLILVTPRTVRLAPRKDHLIYAGQGSSEGPVGEPSRGNFVPPQPPPAPTEPAAAPPSQQPGGTGTQPSIGEPPSPGTQPPPAQTAPGTGPPPER